MLKSVELFAGAGGLGMGLTLADFNSQAVIELDKWACDTIRENQRRGHPLVKHWPLHHMSDARYFDYGRLPEDIDLLAGGPPCQPFSMGGKHRAYNDERDMFPTTVSALRTIKPKAFIIENVKGLTRSTFLNYFQYILHQFEFPEMEQKPGEDWIEHYTRLQKRRTSRQSSGSKTSDGLVYNIVWALLSAANFGVPQKRERVFIVGFRSDTGVRWSFPKETHSYDSLVVDQWITGNYWDSHKIAKPKTPEKLFKRVERLRSAIDRPDLFTLPWITVRDALQDLPDPELSLDQEKVLNHRFQLGARSYIGHTGSPLDIPAKTLKAGDHGVPGGENMMVKDDGSVRYFTVREAARLQTFPDEYAFHGSWTETMRQLGNAVPVSLAHLLAASIADKLLESEQY